MSAFWQASPDGVTAPSEVQSKSRQPGLQGSAPSRDGARLRIAVTATASHGEAKKAACETLAKALGIAASRVWLLHGVTTHEKVLAVSPEPAPLLGRLQTL